MARRLTEVERERANLIRSVRAIIRLKHSLAADKELDEVLEKVQDEFDAAVAEGRPFHLVSGEVIRLLNA